MRTTLRWFESGRAIPAKVAVDEGMKVQTQNLASQASATSILMSIDITPRQKRIEDRKEEEAEVPEGALHMYCSDQEAMVTKISNGKATLDTSKPYSIEGWSGLT